MSTTPIRHGILVGVDGSDSALDAALWAASAAVRFDEPLHLAHVLPKPPNSGGGSEPDRSAQQLRSEGERLLEVAEKTVRGNYRNLVVERSIHSGPPAQALVELSRTARTIVLGRVSTSEMRSMFVGSEVIHVSNHAKCPVVVWRGLSGRQAPDSRPVVVGVDGNKRSGLAVAHAFEFASFLDAPLLAVHAWSEQSTLRYAESSRSIDWGPYEQHEAAVTAEILAGWSEKYPDVTVTRTVERGSARGTLLEHSAEAQLVVVGSRGRSPITSALLGSTTLSLLHHALCPVLICREV